MRLKLFSGEADFGKPVRLARPPILGGFARWDIVKRQSFQLFHFSIGLF